MAATCPACHRVLDGRYEHLRTEYVRVPGSSAPRANGLVTCPAWDEETENVYWLPDYLARAAIEQGKFQQA